MLGDNFVPRKTSRSKVGSFGFVIAAGVAFCLSIYFAFSNSAELDTIFNGCEIKLESVVNPNNAPVASLVRLPGIGIVRAEGIVSYRENFNKEISSRLAFQDCDDLQKVKGIGPKTVQNISRWLKFEAKVDSTGS